jgi:transposase
MTRDQRSCWNNLVISYGIGILNNRYDLRWVSAIPGINAMTAYVLLSEAGRDLSGFRSAPAFASWLGLCPDNRVSGGKVLSSRTRSVNHRLANALRMAAQALFRSQSWLG